MSSAEASDTTEPDTTPTPAPPVGSPVVAKPGMIETLDGQAAELRAARLAKVSALRAAAVDPYPVDFRRSVTCAELAERYRALEPGAETSDRVRVAGRLMLVRNQGKLIFATVRDGSGTVQLFVSKAVIGDDAFAAFADFDLGDWVGVEGDVMTTRKGELSVKAVSALLLAKALRPLPDKWHGLSDTDTRFRQRYVDLMVNDEARRVFEIRFNAIAEIRRLMHARGFLEVETPVLQTVAGGAAARPFVSHHHALDMTLHLRIALELHLKRLLVGGFERVFEIGRVFRNEGISTRHNPEFTMLECYQALADYRDMMDLTEALIAGAAIAATGSTIVPHPDRAPEGDAPRGEPHGPDDRRSIDLTPPWRRATLRELVAERTGLDLHPSMPVEELRRHCDDLAVPYEPYFGPGKLILEIYEKTVEHTLLEPTFVCDYPTEVSPLARRHRDDPLLTERFELIVNGREIANAFTELNDPVDQLGRFEAQAELRAAGDDEANEIDHDYVRALEYGLPPCGGLGIGIDRVAMLLAGVHSIREVVLFPHLRPEVG